MMVMRAAILLELLQQKIDADGVFEEWCVKLFQNDVTPTRDTVIGDLDIATFTGYTSPAAVVFGDPFINSEGNAEVLGGQVQFTQTGTTITNTVYGYYVTDTAGTKLLAAERFATPRTMDAANKAIIIVPRIVEALP